MDSSTPDATPDDSGVAQGSDRICATLASLEVKGVSPQVGDSVSVQVDGTISEIDGEKAYIEPEKVNGQDVPGEDQASEPSEEDMIGKAQKFDSEQYA